MCCGMIRSVLPNFYGRRDAVCKVTAVMMLGFQASPVDEIPYPRSHVSETPRSRAGIAQVVIFLASVKTRRTTEAVAVYGEYGVTDKGSILVPFAVGGTGVVN